MQASPFRSFLSSFLAGPFGIGALCFVILLVLAALGAPLTGVDPIEISENTLLPPSSSFPLGTDELGRDVVISIMYGAQVSLTVGLLAALFATIIGSLIGALAGYYGGLLDTAVMRVAELFQVIPTFILAAVIVALSSPGLVQIVGVISVLAWPQTARLIRGEVLRVKEMEYVYAVRCLGYSESVILAREVIPNSIAPTLALGTLIVGQAMLLEAGLSFLGLSNPDVMTWGRLLNSGQRFLANAWWLSFFPGCAILLTVLAFNLLGDAINSALDPKQREAAKR